MFAQAVRKSTMPECLISCILTREVSPDSLRVQQTPCPETGGIRHEGWEGDNDSLDKFRKHGYVVVQMQRVSELKRDLSRHWTNCDRDHRGEELDTARPELVGGLTLYKCFWVSDIGLRASCLEFVARQRDTRCRR